jgi:hypothetical protein
MSSRRKLREFFVEDEGAGLIDERTMRDDECAELSQTLSSRREMLREKYCDGIQHLRAMAWFA